MISRKFKIMFEYMEEREKLIRKEGFDAATQLFSLAYEKRYKELEENLNKLRNQQKQRTKQKQGTKMEVENLLAKIAVINRDEKLLSILDHDYKVLLETFSSFNSHFSFLLRFYTRQYDIFSSSKRVSEEHAQTNVCEFTDKVSIENSIVLSYLCSSNLVEGKEQKQEISYEEKMQFIKFLGKMKNLKL